MAGTIEERVTELEAKYRVAVAVILVLSAVGLGIGGLSAWAFSRAGSALSELDKFEERKAALVTDVAEGAKAKLGWIPLGSETDEFDPSCEYRVRYTNDSPDVVSAYATEVSRKTLAGFVTDKFFKVKSDSKQFITVAAPDASEQPRLDVTRIEQKCSDSPNGHLQPTAADGGG